MVSSMVQVTAGGPVLGDGMPGERRRLPVVLLYVLGLNAPGTVVLNVLVSNMRYESLSR